MEPNSDLRQPSELTPLILSKIIALKYNCNTTPNLKSLEVKSIDEGVLSEVVEICIVYNNDYIGLKDGEKERNEELHHELPTTFVAKFMRDSLPQPHMFQVEKSFYELQQSAMQQLPELPFLLPTMIYSSPCCIILEKVERARSFTLLNGCPTTHVRQSMLQNLAVMHARFWQGNDTTALKAFFESLSPTPGIGSSLPGKDKQYMFMTCWEEFLSNVSSISDKERRAVRELCQTLETKELSQVHEKVVQFPVTLVHGDYHVANILFPSEEHSADDSDNDKFWMLDWGTCGLGNPLLDVVFFLIVSTNASDHHPDEEGETERLLKYYYSILTSKESSPNAAYIQSTFSYETFLAYFQHALLNQFIVLVCYDKVGRQLIASMSELKKKKKEETKVHFDNVNRKCIRALLSNVMNVEKYDMPKEKSTDVVDEERERRLREGEGLNMAI